MILPVAAALGLAPASAAPLEVLTYEATPGFDTYRCDETYLPTQGNSLSRSYFRFERREQAHFLSIIKPCYETDQVLTEKVFEIPLQGAGPILDFMLSLPLNDAGDAGSHRYVKGQVALAEIDRPHGMVRLFSLHEGYQSCSPSGCVDVSSGLNHIYLYPKGGWETRFEGCGLHGTVAERVSSCAMQGASETAGWSLVTRTPLHPKENLYPKELWRAPDGSLHPSDVHYATEAALSDPQVCAKQIHLIYGVEYPDVIWSVPRLKLDPDLHSELEEYIGLGARTVIPTYHLDKSFVQSPNPFRCGERNRWGNYVLWGPAPHDLETEFVCNPNYSDQLRCLGRTR